MAKISPARVTEAFLAHQAYQPTVLMATPRLSRFEAIL